MITRIPIGRLGVHFKQHEVEVGGVCLVLRDHREVEAAPGAVTIADYKVTRANVANADFPGAIFPRQIQNTSLIHAVCHLTEGREEVEFRDPLPAPDPRDPPVKFVILHASSVNDGVSQSHENTGPKVWLSMKSLAAYNRVADWLRQFLDLSFEDAVKIADATDRAALAPDIQRRYAQLLDITHPGDPTASLAFRLLCEAWLMNNGKPTTCEGIPITPPGSLDDWLAPFKVGNSTPDEAAVAAMMGKTLEAQATAVLNAVGQGDALSISTAATTFVTACSQFLSTAGGAV
jgi:hypothetical protein